MLGTETFAWNSSHRQGSGPKTQTQTSDSFRIKPFQTHWKIIQMILQAPPIKPNVFRSTWEVGTRFRQFRTFGSEGFKSTFRSPLLKPNVFRSTWEVGTRFRHFRTFPSESQMNASWKPLLKPNLFRSTREVGTRFRQFRTLSSESQMKAFRRPLLKPNVFRSTWEASTRLRTLLEAPYQNQMFSGGAERGRYAFSSFSYITFRSPLLKPNVFRRAWERSVRVFVIFVHHF